ncbi:MAG TPA: 2-phosphosulfolactate phosphatase [Trueperaceae bacterium]
MKIRVDLLPHRQPESAYRDVVVLIDVLRSCTVAPLLFDGGLEDLYLSPSLRRARAFAAQEGALLLGERRGLPPEGFNYGNSPTELGQVDFTGRSVVMVSENAPQALPVVSCAQHVLLGSLYNADAVVRRALALAESEVTLVCSGFGGSEDLDDALTAGYLAARLRQQAPDSNLAGAAPMAVSLLKVFPDPLEALWQSRAGQTLRQLELQQDIAVAAFVSQSERVPQLERQVELQDSPLFHFGAAVA